MIRPRRTGFPLLLLCSVLVLAACGSNAGTPGDDSSASASATPGVSPSAASPTASAPAPTSAPAPAPGQAAAASLTVEFMADGQNTTDTWTLQCEGTTPLPGSNVPDPAAACALLAGQGATLFAEPEAGMMCTQIIAGMQRAHVTGTVNGSAVDASFALTDGCQISRWENLTALLGPANGSL
ncbi:serine protease inhibitor [Arthrobacter sp. zg-Y40]|uniref:serine protease inhibitor n=1 Tax=Arthrobacter sp. zg-Y40 TaxID=2886939 RepID=UPI001D14CF81|nr:serine protease inhibitor [Arthrobacter sp. zg-Y40]MCC3278888.1 serine protease inhibitor [Arthrobacter sp. zg-Y40]